MYTELQDIQEVPIPQIRKVENDLGWTTYLFDSPDPRAVQIDILFVGGRSREYKKLSAFAAHQLIRENDKKISGKTLSEHVNECGAQLTMQSYLDGSVITLKSLDRFVPRLLPILCSVLLEPQFETFALDLFKEKQIQELAIDKNYNDTLAYRLLMEQLFGKNHPYGYSMNEPALLDLTTHDLRKQHEQAYTLQNCVVIVMSRKPEPILDLLTTTLITHLKPSSDLVYQESRFKTEPGHDITQDDRYGPQWAIKMGCVISEIHQNLGSWFIMNNLLGGFYGSRLLKTIREEMGLTYDISSQIEIMQHASFFSIHTEVSPSNKLQLLDSVRDELVRLKTDPVSFDELRMVKNYTLGEYLRLLDGPQRQIQTLKSLLLEGLDFHILEKIFTQIIRIEPDDLWHDFQSFVDFDALTKVMVR